MIKGMDHVGVSVSDLNRSIEFYRDLIGMELVVEEEKFHGELYEKILALRGANGKVALLKKGNMQLELFEFLRPTPKAGDPQRPVSDHGITHFCIEVEDIDSEYERLKAGGMTFHCPPLNFFGTAKATYGRDPDGNVIELLEMTAAPAGSA